MASFLENHPSLWQLISRNTLQIGALGLQMYAQPYTGKIQNSRDNSRFNYFNIWHTYKLCHQESCCTHNWRHKLTTCGGGCLYGTSKFFAIAQLFHHRNGKGTSTRYIGYRGAGNSTHKGTGNNCYLGRTATGPASNGIGNINEEFAQTSAFQISAKENKQENKGGGYSQRNTKNTFSSKIQMANQLIRSKSSMT